MQALVEVARHAAVCGAAHRHLRAAFVALELLRGRGELVAADVGRRDPLGRRRHQQPRAALLVLALLVQRLLDLRLLARAEPARRPDRRPPTGDRRTSALGDL